MTNPLFSQLPVVAPLKAHCDKLVSVHLRDLFAQDAQRFQRFSTEACGLLLDYSKNRITAETLNLLIQLATEANLPQWIEQMFCGGVINNTERRAALHVALRNRSNEPILVDGQDVMPGVNAVLAKIRPFSESVRSGDWRGYTGKPIESVVNIGIGGSDLGPLMVTRALKAYCHPRLRSYFVSNVDATHIGETLAQLNPETTLYIIASKTFTTQETMMNAQTARRWFIEKSGNEQAIAKHFVAVSTNTLMVKEFGIDTQNMFEFLDLVGGRFSLWSAIGLPIVIAIGMDHFEQLLSGAHALDNHFRKTPFEKNLPVLLGLLDIWNNDFLGANTHVVLPYDFALEHFSAYLQQLVMESLGKRVTREGVTVNYPTCPIDWGAPGNNGQHAFYQLLHQGTRLVPSDFIVAIESQYGLPHHQEAVLSNALAQTHALMMGRNEAETRSALEASGVKGDALTQQLPHRIFPGNQPSNTIVYQKLTPATLGALIALYEHKTFVQSVCWNINPFDQWGVELGKQVANVLLPEITGEKPCGGHDGSTDGLLNYIKARRSSR